MKDNKAVKKEVQEDSTVLLDGRLGIGDYLRAGYSHFYIYTDEMERSIKLLTDELKEHEDKQGNHPFENVEVWGCTPPPVASKEEREQLEAEFDANPMAPIAKLEAMPKNSVMLLKNYHWFMKDPHGVPDYDIVQYVQDRLKLFRGAKTRRIMIILAPVPITDGLPMEISREFIPLRFGLPEHEEIAGVLENAIRTAEKSPNFLAPTDEEKERIIENSRGLTKQEAENAYFYSMVKSANEGEKSIIDPLTVIDIRMKYLEDVAGVKYEKYEESFDTLIGYDVIKKFLLKVMPNPKAKGVLILGPAGTGKSHLAKSVSNMTGIPMLTVEMAEWFTSLYGETGHRVRRGIEAIMAFKRVIVFIDEIEKGLSGTKGTGGPGGAHMEGHEETQRAMSQFLKFMSDRPDGIFVIATCNNIFGMDPAYIRAERWDCAPFFVDLPDWHTRQAIFDFYKAQYEVEGDLVEGKTEGWSGAEIKSCCRLAHIMDVSIEESSKLIIPVSETMREEIKYLRDTCKGRTIPAAKMDLGPGFHTDRAIDI